MAEETTSTPVETVPEQAVPVQEIPMHTEPEPPEKARKGNPLLLALTVLLVVVGVVDLALWGLAGFYFLRGF